MKKVEKEKNDEELTTVFKQIVEDAKQYIDESISKLKEEIRTELQDIRKNVANGNSGSGLLDVIAKADKKAVDKLLVVEVLKSFAPALAELIPRMLQQSNPLTEFMLRRDIAFTYSQMQRDRAIWDKLVSEGKVDQKYKDEVDSVTGALIGEPLHLMIDKMRDRK